MIGSMENGGSPEPILSQTDRLRIEAEERLRAEIRNKIQRKRRAWIWWLIGIPAGLLLIMWIAGSVAISTSFAVGSDCRLQNPPLVFSTPSGIEHFKSLPEGREAGVEGVMMRDRGEVFEVQPGTRIRVLEADGVRRRIAVLEGIHRFEQGWVETGWLGN